MSGTEKDLVTAFRAMDERSQAYLLRLAKMQAADCPAQRKCRLRLVSEKLSGQHESKISPRGDHVALSIVRRSDSSFTQ